VLAVKTRAGPATPACAAVRVMLDAHMDEIGFMIFGANSDGSLKFPRRWVASTIAFSGQSVLVGPEFGSQASSA